jgi:hypothetical protein
MGAVIQGIATRNELPGRSWNVTTRKSTAHMGIEIMVPFIEGQHEWANRYVLPRLLLYYSIYTDSSDLDNGTPVTANGCATIPCVGSSTAATTCPIPFQNRTVSTAISGLVPD